MPRTTALTPEWTNHRWRSSPTVLATLRTRCWARVMFPRQTRPLRPWTLRRTVLTMVESSERTVARVVFLQGGIPILMTQIAIAGGMVAIGLTMSVAMSIER